MTWSFLVYLATIHLVTRTVFIPIVTLLINLSLVLIHYIQVLISSLLVAMPVECNYSSNTFHIIVGSLFTSDQYFFQLLLVPNFTSSYSFGNNTCICPSFVCIYVLDSSIHLWNTCVCSSWIYRIVSQTGIGTSNSNWKWINIIWN